MDTFYIKNWGPQIQAPPPFKETGKGITTIRSHHKQGVAATTKGNLGNYYNKYYQWLASIIEEANIHTFMFTDH